jgi:hypothetical protein
MPPPDGGHGAPEHICASASSGDSRETPPPPRAREFHFVLLLASVLTLLGSVPYIHAYWSAPDGEVFMGFVGRGTPGTNGYFMLARQAQEGYHLMENLLTPEPLPRNYFNLEWWLMGKAAALSGLTLEAIFHLDRILSVFAFCLASYYLASLAIASVLWRRVAVAIICLGSGFGWVIVLLNGVGFGLPVPQDVEGVQVFGYLINKPHFIRAFICAMLTYGFIVEGLRRNQLRWFILSGIAALAHSSMRPYHILELHVLYVLVPALLAWRDHDWRLRRFLPFAVAGAVHAPAVAYYGLYAMLGSLGMSGWERVPGFLIQDVLALSWPFLILVITIPFFLRLEKQSEVTVVLTAWVVTAWLICNLYPYWGAGFEAAFPAYHLVPPILVLAGPLQWAGQRLAKWPVWAKCPARPCRLLLVLALIVLSLPSSGYVYATMFSSLHDKRMPQWTYYIPRPVYESIGWLASHVPQGAVILASHDTSQFIPRFGHLKVVTGHDMLTANYSAKNWMVHRFYSQTGDLAFKENLVQQLNIRFIVEGPLEARLGQVHLGQVPWLEVVYENGPLRIHAVTHNDPNATHGVTD